MRYSSFDALDADGNNLLENFITYHQSDYPTNQFGTTALEGNRLTLINGGKVKQPLNLYRYVDNDKAWQSPWLDGEFGNGAGLMFTFGAAMCAPVTMRIYGYVDELKRAAEVYVKRGGSGTFEKWGETVGNPGVADLTDANLGGMGTSYFDIALSPPATQEAMVMLGETSAGGFYGIINTVSDTCTACTVCDPDTKATLSPCSSTTNAVCGDIACPAHSTGTNLAAGDCSCNPGFSGTIATVADNCTACVEGQTFSAGSSDTCDACAVCPDGSTTDALCTTTSDTTCTGEHRE